MEREIMTENKSKMDRITDCFNRDRHNVFIECDDGMSIISVDEKTESPQKALKALICYVLNDIHDQVDYCTSTAAAKGESMIEDIIYEWQKEHRNN